MLRTEVFHQLYKYVYNTELIIDRTSAGDYFEFYGSLEVTVSLERDDAVKTMTVLPT